MKKCCYDFPIYSISYKVGQGFKWKMLNSIFKNVFLRFKSRHLCCGLQHKIIKNKTKKNVPRTTKFHGVETCKNCVIWFEGFLKTLVLITRFFQPWWDRLDKWWFAYFIFSIARAIVLWDISKQFTWIFIRNNYWNIPDTLRNFCPTFQGKKHI